MDDDILDASILHNVQHILGNTLQQGLAEISARHMFHVPFSNLLDVGEVTGVDVLGLVGQQRLEHSHPVVLGEAGVEEVVLHTQRDGSAVGVGLAARGDVQANLVSVAIREEGDGLAHDPLEAGVVDELLQLLGAGLAILLHVLKHFFLIHGVLYLQNMY